MISCLAYAKEAGSQGQILRKSHEIRNKINQKQQLNKIAINTRVKPRHCDDCMDTGGTSPRMGEGRTTQEQLPRTQNGVHVA